MAAIDLSEMDIVYPVLVDGSNEELRYSLRSLKNLPHRKVFVISSGIDWLSDEVEQILVDIDSDSSLSKFERVNEKLLVACDCEEISTPFILMNDDFFIMKPAKKLPYYCLGNLEDRLAKYDRYGSYAQDLRSALDLLVQNDQDTLDFEPHVPIMLRKDHLEYILRSPVWKGLSSGHRRSLYCNFFKETPTFIKPDVKVYEKSMVFDAKSKFLSTENASFSNCKVGMFIRSKFPDKCKYEV